MPGGVLSGDDLGLGAPLARRLMLCYHENASGYEGASMSQPSPPSGRPPIPWALRSRGRLLMSLLAAGLGGLATARLPGEVGLTICFDLAAIVYVGLFVALMNRATPEHAAELSSHSEPSDMRILAGVILLSLVSITAVGALQHPDTCSRPVRMLHLGASLAAIILA